MKKFIVIITCFLFTQNLAAQTPDYFGNNPTWSDQYDDIIGEVPIYNKHTYLLDGTETIGAYTYHIMRYRNYTSNDYWGPFVYQAEYASLKVRQEGRSVYYYDTVAEFDSLLISYELEVGDDLIGQPGYFFPSSVITDIDSILVDDTYRRVLYFDGGEPNARYIEGIAYLWGELDHNYGSCFAQMHIIDYEPSFGTYGFNCYGENGSSLYKPLPDLSCNFTLGITESEPSNQLPLVFPNPASTDLLIRFNQTEIDKIEILNLLGQVIKSYPTNSQNIQTLDIKDIPEGMYLIQFSEKGIIKTQEKLIKR
ncbi:MAG: T9SS type A sorting domain-containing protein [Crocinitomix sp.]|nr:T9SS type A sorting domain-containing protein [Crocinitomix sp.]